MAKKKDPFTGSSDALSTARSHVWVNCLCCVLQSGSLQHRAPLGAGTFMVRSRITHMSHTYVSVFLVPENDLAMGYRDSAFNRFLPNVLHSGWAAVPSHQQHVHAPVSPCLSKILTLSDFHSSANIKEKGGRGGARHLMLESSCLGWQ
jgi:hypothetical protein